MIHIVPLNLRFGSESCDVTPQAVLKGKRTWLPSYYHSQLEKKFGTGLQW